MQEFSLLVTPERIDYTNYVEWFLNSQNKIQGTKRWGHVSGIKVAPKDEKYEEYERWEDENYLVKSWLLDSDQRHQIALHSSDYNEGNMGHRQGDLFSQLM